MMEDQRGMFPDLEQTGCPLGNYRDLMVRSNQETVKFASWFLSLRGTRVSGSLFVITAVASRCNRTLPIALCPSVRSAF